MTTLREIFTDETAANFRATDKNRGARQHLGLYEVLFDSYRDSATKVFEIGINRGGSIKAWQRYFSNATIYGLDIRRTTLKNVDLCDRVVPLQLDQSNREQLESFASEGPFDIGIDDGSHIWEHQILSFNSLWPAIKPGGLYVIEDVLTSYDRWIKESKASGGKAGKIDITRGGSISCVEYFRRMIDEINFYGGDWDSIPVSEWTTHQRTVDWIIFRSNSITIRKRECDEDTWTRPRD